MRRAAALFFFFFFLLCHSAKIGQKEKHWTHCHSWRQHSKYGEFRHVSWKYGDLRSLDSPSLMEDWMKSKVNLWDLSHPSRLVRAGSVRTEQGRRERVSKWSHNRPSGPGPLIDELGQLLQQLATSLPPSLRTHQSSKQCAPPLQQQKPNSGS